MYSSTCPASSHIHCCILALTNNLPHTTACPALHHTASQLQQRRHSLVCHSRAHTRNKTAMAVTASAASQSAYISYADVLAYLDAKAAGCLHHSILQTLYKSPGP